MSSKFLRHALLASSLVATAIGFAPAAFAGAGGIAGSASFSGGSGDVVTGAATAAAIGQNGASAWSFNKGGADTSNSAGAIGTAGATTITGFSTGTITSVQDTAPATPATNSNSFSGGPDIQFGTNYTVDAYKVDAAQ
jgi:hypothetical protein